jgi:hypothetical protein
MFVKNRPIRPRCTYPPRHFRGMCGENNAVMILHLQLFIVNVEWGTKERKKGVGPAWPYTLNGCGWLVMAPEGES